MAFLDKILQDSARYYDNINNISQTLWYGERGIFSNMTAMYYITISTTSNTTSFGTKSDALSVSCSNSTRGVFGNAALEYITFAVLGNSSNFGTLTNAANYMSACSNGIKGIFCGNGYSPIYYINIATTSSSIYFGKLKNNEGMTGGTACSNNIRGLIAWINMGIHYITMSTLSNSEVFGTLLESRYYFGSLADTTRGIIGGGASSSSGSNVIQYVTINTLGNAVDFGDLTVARGSVGACNNATRGLFAGGSPYVSSNVIDYITIQTIGNAIDFGDLWVSGAAFSGCSGN